MTKEQSFEKKNWNVEDWKKSQDKIDRLVWYIAGLSPHNLWEGEKALKQELKEIVGRLEKITIGYYDLDKIEYENSNDALWEVKKSLDKIKEEYGL